MSHMGKSLRNLIDEATEVVESRSAAGWRALYENTFVGGSMKNWRAREYSIQQQIHVATGVPMEKIGVIGGENCVQILMGEPISQVSLPRLNETLQQMDCLTHVIWL